MEVILIRVPWELLGGAGVSKATPVICLQLIVPFVVVNEKVSPSSMPVMSKKAMSSPSFPKVTVGVVIESLPPTVWVKVKVWVPVAIPDQVES